MSNKNDFYIYEWYNKENNEVFYVGKGRNGRYKDTKSRNQYFKNYYNKYKCDVRKVKTDLVEDEAFKLEIELIKSYREKGQAKCNITNGGEGSTFEEGSWNDYFRKLQYLHGVVKAMDDMPNEEDYDPINLKTKSLDELEELYDRYLEYKENEKWLKENKKELQISGFFKEDLTDFELETENKEIIMLSNLIAKNIAMKNEEFSEFLNYKTEEDFICIDFDSDKFLELMLDDIDYCRELANVTINSLYLLKLLGNNPKFSLFIKVKSYSIKDNYIHIKFNTSDDKTISRVKINLYDIVWGILIFKEKPLYQIIYEEIFYAPFIDLMQEGLDGKTTIKSEVDI